MASIVKLGKGKNPPRAIDFNNTTGKRDRLRLGIVTHDDAEECCRRVEKLLTAKRLNNSPDTPTAEWVAGVSDDIHVRLARFGLCEPRVPFNAAPTLGEWLTKYIDQRRSELKPGSVKRLQDTAERLKSHFGEDVRIDELTPNDAADWRASMITGGLSEATTRLHCRNAKSLFAGAVDRELIVTNPCRKLRSSSIAAKRDRYVSPQESLTILDECHSIQWKLVFGLARFAGLRCPSETHRLTWANVDFDHKRLVVYAPKTDSTRIVPLVPTLLSILQDAFDQAAEGSTKIVTFSASSTNIHRGLEKIITRAGIVPWDDLLQTLRRCAESDFAKHNPQHAVSKWIGHSMAVSERHYLQVDEEILDAGSTHDGVSQLRAAQSAAVGPDTSPQVQVTRRNDDSNTDTIITPAKAENPRKNRGFCEWDRSDLNREPKDYESSALTD